MLENAVAVAIALIVVAVVYRSVKPRVLGSRRPFVCLVPKFRFSVALPAALRNGAHVGELSERMTTLGFAVEHDDESSVRYVRGSVLGDFSVKIAKVRVTLRRPLAPRTEAVVEYGAFAAFDTGDLWKFSQELKDRLERE